MTQAAAQGKVWLTQEAFDKLTQELEDLKGPIRQDIIARISAARDEGDLKENGGYHAAREEQGKLEGRIRQLEDMLLRAEVGETPRPRPSCSAPARWRTLTAASRSTRRSRPSARPSSARPRATP